MDKIDQLKGLKTNMDGHWTTASLKNGTEVFSVTMCFVADNAPELHEITMTGMAIPLSPQSSGRGTALGRVVSNCGNSLALEFSTKTTGDDILCSSRSECMTRNTQSQ